MSSTHQLWAPAPKSDELSRAEKLSRQNANILPGTWLQLSPVASTPVSPALSAQLAGDVKEDLALRSSNDKFLSNNFVSRSSSMSSDASGPVLQDHPPLTPKVAVASNIERREMSVGRLGGLGAVFGSN